MRRAGVTQPAAPRVSCLETSLARLRLCSPRAVRLVTLFVAGLSLACGEPLSPRDVAGTYALQRVAGNSLPTIQYANGDVVVRVFAETLSFTPDGRGEDVTVRQSETVTGGLVTGPERRETAFGFRVVQGRIEIAFDCPPAADCVAPPHIVARPTPNGLEVQYAPGARVPLIYARLASPF